MVLDFKYPSVNLITVDIFNHPAKSMQIVSCYGGFIYGTIAPILIKDNTNARAISNKMQLFIKCLKTPEGAS